MDPPGIEPGSYYSVEMTATSLVVFDKSRLIDDKIAEDFKPSEYPP